MKKFAQLQYEELKSSKINENITSFTLQPLERGFGNTIGNAIRRVLLSSVSGVAPFGLKIENVEHEFQTINGVTEDVVQLILNIKNVRFIYNKDIFKDGEVIRVSLDSKSGDITTADLTLPPGVEVVDKNIKIATTAQEKSLTLELFLIAGRGFISFEENKIRLKELKNKIESKISNGSLIAVDSDFSPVENVSYESIELNSSSSIIEEKLTINIQTDGSINAKKAIANASNILIEHLKTMKNVSNLKEEKVFGAKEEIVKINTVKAIPISHLDFSVRSYNCLWRKGIDTLDKLSKLTIRELEEIDNLGQKSIREIKEKLAKRNIFLKDGEE